MDKRLKGAFPRPPQCSNKRGQNIAGAGHLISARLPGKPSVQTRATTGNKVVGVRNCGRVGRRQLCSLCPHLGEASNPRAVVQQVMIHHSGEIIKITQNITCIDVGCLYLLSCTKHNCRKQYIGESGRPIFKRFKEHLDSSEDADTNCPVGVHFQLPGHSKHDKELIPIDIVKGNKAGKKARERMLINQYKMITFGLNVRL